MLNLVMRTLDTIKYIIDSSVYIQIAADLLCARRGRHIKAASVLQSGPEPELISIEREKKVQK